MARVEFLHSHFLVWGLHRSLAWGFQSAEIPPALDETRLEMSLGRDRHGI
jgi:hypothetical protein